tara:strand:- start:4765 stop:5229 length:465 start_codon:yes stop_codon:yes gene_type:complete
MEKSLHEIFTEVEQAKSYKAKAEKLKEYETDGLKTILRGAFDTRIEWKLPTGKPPYTESTAPDYDLADLQLVREARTLGRFATFEGRDTNQSQGLNKLRTEQLYIQLLEGLHPTEANIVIEMVKKKLPYKGLTAKIANRAFPNLIPEDHMIVPK